MKLLHAFFIRLSGLFAPNRQQDRDDELASHLQLNIDDNIRSGMTPDEARRHAIIRLGGIEPTRQAWRERSTLPLVENFLQDLRFALRQLRKNPGFTLTAVLVLSLGIAASTSIFGFVDAALIRPLPYPEPNRLVDVTESIALFPRASISYLDYLDWKRLNNVFASFDVFNSPGFLLRTPRGADLVAGARVSDGFFRTLGISPILGRDFYPGEDLPGKPATVLITYNAWQQRFGGNPKIVGQVIDLSNHPFTVIGVLPQSFEFALRGNAEFWAPLQGTGSCFNRRGCHNLNGVARLKDGVTIDAALTQMRSIAQRLEEQYPDTNRGQGASVLPLSYVINGDIRPFLLTLLAGASLLLLIACVNVSSLLLVRAERRRREFAVRGALGATRRRLICQFVTEGLALTITGTVIGVLMAQFTMRLPLRLISKDMLVRMPYLHDLGLTPHVLVFASTVSLFAALLFSMIPTLRLPSAAIQEGLSESSRTSSGVLWRRFGSNLVVIELSIAVVLLVGAGLLGKSFYHLLHVDVGFQPDHLATVGVALPTIVGQTDEGVISFTRQMLTRISSLPGVESAGVTSVTPVSFNGNTTWIRFAGRAYNGEHNEVNERDVSPTYFTTLRTRLLRGRFFTSDEDKSKPKVAIINQALARKYFPNEDPVGKMMGDTGLTPTSMTQIVGVVDDIREGPLDADLIPAVYYPIYQSPNDYTLVVRTTQAPEYILPALGATIRQINASAGVYGEETMAGHISQSQSATLHRGSAWLVGVFAILALLLSTVGLYGVIAYSVSQRSREIGVRMALGAQRSTIHRLILTEAGRLAAYGIGAGILCSLAATTLIGSMLFGVHSWDFPTLTGVAIVLAGAALLASYVPAHRAASINPIEALRTE